MTSPVGLTFEFLTQWHLVFTIRPPPPCHLPSEAWIVLGSAFSPPRSKNTSFSFGPLKQLPAYEVEKMTLLSHDEWSLTPGTGLLWGSHGDAFT